MKRFASFLAAVVVLGFSVSARADYKVDPVHSSANFMALHANVGHVYGRFNSLGGTFNLDDADATKSAFNIEVKADSVDTNQGKRDEHLKSPDFLNAKQYPTISFKSTAVKKGDGNKLEVTGDLTLHGVTNPVTVMVEVLGKGEFPPSVARQGIEAMLAVKQSDFGMKGMPGGVGDEIRLLIAIEGVKQ